MRLSDADLIALKDRNPVDAVAGQWVTLRRKGQKFVGPCPLCSDDPASRTAMRFECDSEKWVCAVCRDGGDVIRLVAKRNGLDERRDFGRIVELLGGAAKAEETPATAARAGGASFRRGGACSAPEAFAGDALRAAWHEGWRKAKAQQDAAARYRERERKRLFDNFWCKARPLDGRDPVSAYLDLRGLEIPPNARVKAIDDCPMFLDGTEHEPVVVHRGPAMLCAILAPDPVNGGMRFSGLHFTWIDLSQPKGKALVRHPETGEPLPAKKARGSKQGGYIDLGGCAPQIAERVIAGEGNENTLTAYTALKATGRDLTRTHFRSGIDLGNLAGRALDRAAHPTATTANGRARMIPGVAPDMASPAMPLPPQIRQVVWMCDGDSDGPTTRNAMARVEARHARDGLEQRFLWPGEGVDWNDRVMGEG